MTDQNTTPGKDWDNLRFRPHRDRRAQGSPDGNANSRFVIGLVVVVMLVLSYPWYAYWVQTRLMARDLASIGERFEAEMRSQSRAVAEQAELAAKRRQGIADRRRVAAVRVVGAMATGGRTVVIVEMGNADFRESRATICRQASRWLKRSTAGMTLHVQSQRGRSPAKSVGAVEC